MTEIKIPMSENECVALGGHCWVEADATRFPYTPLVYLRHCKHCMKQQTGVKQPPVRWEDQ